MESQHLWNEGSVPEAYLQTEEETVQVHIVTLKAYLSELATIKAFDEGIDDFNKLATRVDELLTTELSDAKEFVEVTENFIRVGINCDLIDDNTISQALELVGRLDSFKPGTMVQMGQLVHVYENKISRRKRAN
jgi:hypothetical protein